MKLKRFGSQITLDSLNQVAFEGMIKIFEECIKLSQITCFDAWKPLACIWPLYKLPCFIVDLIEARVAGICRATLMLSHGFSNAVFILFWFCV